MRSLPEIKSDNAEVQAAWKETGLAHTKRKGQEHDYPQPTGRPRKYPRVEALTNRQRDLEDKFARITKRTDHTANDSALKAIGHAITNVRREAMLLRPKSEGELRALEQEGFLDEAPQGVTEGDSDFDLLRMSCQTKQLNFATLGHSIANRLGIAGSTCHDDYGENSQP